MNHNWTCNCCGRRFDTLPMDYGFPAPHNWFGLPEAERGTRAKLTEDICIIDDTEYYVRGCLEIPVIDSAERLIWGVWVSVSEESLQYILDRWDSPVMQNEPLRFGWLCSWIKGYPEPFEIRCHIFLQSDDSRPRIVLQPTQYPLSVEQRNGITLDRVKELAAGAGHL